MDEKVGFSVHNKAIKNALKWRKPDISIFISKKESLFKLKNGKLYLFYIE